LVRTRLDSNQTGSIRNAQRMRGMGADPLGEGGSQPRVQKCRIAAGNESGQFCTLKKSACALRREAPRIGIRKVISKSDGADAVISSVKTLLPA